MNFKKAWKKHTEAWYGIFIYLILGFIIAYIFNIVLGFILQTDTPVVAVFSESMVPTFYRGDMIIVYGDENVRVGDIIVFDTPYKEYPIIHRVYGINNNEISTKGDNNPVADPWKISKDSIHGKGLLKIPLLGWVKIIFTKITGFR